MGLTGNFHPTLHATQARSQPCPKPTPQDAEDDLSFLEGEPQLPALKMNVFPHSDALVQAGTGASLPP